MTICYFSDRLEAVEGQLVRTVNAVERNKRKGKDQRRTLDVYREFEDGYAECRNLYYCMYGYRVGFPHDENSMYYNGSCSFTEKEEKFDLCKEMHFDSRPLTEAERELVIQKYPAFSYTLKKWRGTIRETLKALAVWKKHPEVEFILSAGFKNIAFNKGFWKLTEKKRKEIVLFMRKNPDCRNFTLLDIQRCIKNGYDIGEFSLYKVFLNITDGNVSFDLYRYLVKIGKANRRGVALYRDYWNLLVQSRHSTKDAYWEYPKDLQERHDLLRDEIHRVERLKQKEELKKKQDAYSKAVRKIAGITLDENGYSVYVPETVEEIMHHAERLHQCLVTCDYISRVIAGKCVLVFVTKDGEPEATAELLKGDRIGQFYKDELDRDECLPSVEVRALVDRWIAKKSEKAVA